MECNKCQRRKLGMSVEVDQKGNCIQCSRFVFDPSPEEQLQEKLLIVSKDLMSYREARNWATNEANKLYMYIWSVPETQKSVRCSMSMQPLAHDLYYYFVICRTVKMSELVGLGS